MSVRALGIAAFAVSLVACAEPAHRSDLGVVFPAAQAHDIVRALGLQASEYWTPTPADVARLEAGLRRALERAAVEPTEVDRLSIGDPGRRAYVAQVINEILEHFGDYRRQYVGIIADDGARKIVANCFPAHRGSMPDEFADWRQRFVVVSDGGAAFWRIQFDVATDRYDAFDVNGEA